MSIADMMSEHDSKIRRITDYSSVSEEQKDLLKHYRTVSGYTLRAVELAIKDIQSSIAKESNADIKDILIKRRDELIIACSLISQDADR